MSWRGQSYFIKQLYKLFKTAFRQGFTFVPTCLHGMCHELSCKRDLKNLIANGLQVQLDCKESGDLVLLHICVHACMCVFGMFMSGPDGVL